MALNSHHKKPELSNKGELISVKSLHLKSFFGNYNKLVCSKKTDNYVV